MGIDQHYEDYDREREEIEAAYARGDLNEEQRNAELRSLDRDFRALEDSQESFQIDGW